MLWTDLSVMVYMVPLIVTAFVLLLVADFFGLASLADIHCPVCQKRFGDALDLRRHMKCMEEGKKEAKKEFTKAA